MAQRITKSLVDRMQPGDQIWDSDIKGFGVRCQGSTPSFMLKTRINGRQRWIQIGKYGSPYTVETARREALRILSAAKHGREADAAAGPSPVANADQRAMPVSPTVATMAALYLKEHGSKLKPKSVEEYTRLLRLAVLPTFGASAITEITKADVSRFHVGLAKTPRKANYAVAVLSAIINWAIEQQHCPATTPNPCIKLKKYKETSRERYLSHEEIQRLFAILDDLDGHDGEPSAVTASIRLLLLTGARLNEVLTLKWSYVDVERSTLWLPDSKTGKKAIHLSEQALALLQRMPRATGNVHVVPGMRAGAHLVNLQKPWRRIRAMAGLDDVRIHDLRHSYASIAINAGASLSMVGKLLGHRQPQTTMRYAHLADDPLRDLNNRIGASIAKAAGGKPGAN